jgi:ABC-type microcin C transport system duplicated ATPase subunit YejF
MHNGRVVEQGASDEIFGNPQEDYTRRLMRAAFDLEVA